MGSSNSKVRCLFLPAQSGKTRKVEEEITELKRLCGISGSRSIDIFISANNRLLVYQTSARLRRDLGADTDIDVDSVSDSISIVSDDDEASDAVIKGKIFSWTHGKITGIAPDALADKILLEEIEMVFMCANKRRFTYLAAMLDRLTKHNMFRRNPAQIYIWIDEADSSMPIWRQFEAAATENPAITQITLVSATFGRVLKKYERLRIVPYEQTHPECYRRLVDCQQEVVSCGLRDPCQFVLFVLSKHPEIMESGTRCFIPGAYTKESHYEIADELQKLGFAVVVINGECKELRIPDGPTIDLREYLSCPDPEMLPDEFNQTLAELYIAHMLWRFPFAITGYLCIQRGVTFQCAPIPERHDGFVFTHGIIPPIRDKAEAYQTMARMFGNTGGFSNYVRPVIYADEKTFAGVCDQEETAVYLPRMVFAEGLENVGKEEFKRAATFVAPMPESIRVKHADPRKTVPIIVPITNPSTDLFDALQIHGKEKKLALIRSEIAESHPSLCSMFDTHYCIQITCPRDNTSGSYKRHILDVVKASEKDIGFAIDITAEDKPKNCFNCYIDKFERRLCFVVWNGAVSADDTISHI